jgi:hypothetical protein
MNHQWEAYIYIYLYEGPRVARLVGQEFSLLCSIQANCGAQSAPLVGIIRIPS